MEGFAFQYLEIKLGKYGNIKNCAKKKSGNLAKMSFDKNGPKIRELKSGNEVGNYLNYLYQKQQ